MSRRHHRTILKTPDLPVDQQQRAQGHGEILTRHGQKTKETREFASTSSIQQEKIQENVGSPRIDSRDGPTHQSSNAASSTHHHHCDPRDRAATAASYSVVPSPISGTLHCETCGWQMQGQTRQQFCGGAAAKKKAQTRQEKASFLLLYLKQTSGLHVHA